MRGTDLRRSPQWLPIRSSTSLENACSLHWAENSAQSPACHHWQQSLMCCPNHPFKTISEGVKRTNLFNFFEYLPMVSVCNSTKYVPYREGLRFTFQLAYLVSFAFCTLMHTCILVSPVSADTRRCDRRKPERPFQISSKIQRLRECTIIEEHMIYFDLYFIILST